MRNACYARARCGVSSKGGVKARAGAGLDVSAWLCDLGLERYVPAFLDAEVTPEVLLELTDGDLRELRVAARAAQDRASCHSASGPPIGNDPEVRRSGR